MNRRPLWHTNTTTILTSAAELKCRQAVKFWGRELVQSFAAWTWHQNLGAVAA